MIFRRRQPAFLGESDEFAAAALEFLDGLYRSAVRLKRNADEAQDIVQEIGPAAGSRQPATGNRQPFDRIPAPISNSWKSAVGTCCLPPMARLRGALQVAGSRLPVAGSRRGALYRRG